MCNSVILDCTMHMEMEVQKMQLVTSSAVKGSPGERWPVPAPEGGRPGGQRFPGLAKVGGAAPCVTRQCRGAAGAVSERRPPAPSAIRGTRRPYRAKRAMHPGFRWCPRQPPPGDQKDDACHSMEFAERQWVLGATSTEGSRRHGKRRLITRGPKST